MSEKKERKPKRSEVSGGIGNLASLLVSTVGGKNFLKFQEIDNA